MFRKIFILFLALYFAGSAAAYAEIYLGGRYGVGMTMLYFMPHQNEKIEMTPINAAVAFRYCNSEAQDYVRYMNLMVEFGYAERSYSMNTRPIVSSDTTAGGRATRVSQVLELPLVMQARIPLYKNFNLLVTGVVYGAYYLKNTQKYEVGGVLVNERFEYGHFDGFEYGVGGGLGFSLSVGKTDFGVDARYMAGMSYLYKPTVSSTRFLYESMPMQIIISFSVMRKIF
ncbi:MAG: PorT family protein [Prevotellaceae bacterium]|nr:PorT family protein [Prevotellaceae bacterium]